MAEKNQLRGRLRALEGKKGFLKNLKEESRETRKSQYPSFRHFLLEKNAGKNRFMNTILYDQSRVVLWREGDESADYIHASSVDGFEKKGAYILTQFPLEKTVTDFWRMIWQRRCGTIVLLEDIKDWPTRFALDMPEKIYKSLAGTGIQYWTDTTHTGPEYDVRHIKLTKKGKPPHHTTIIQYKKWEVDEEVPPELSTFVGIVRHYQTHRLHTGPTVILCNTGITRSGTFTALDISIQRLKSTGKVNVQQTIEALRSQRYGCVFLESHHIFLTHAIVQYAAVQGCLDGVPLDLASFSQQMTPSPPLPQLNTQKSCYLSTLQKTSQ